MKAPISTALANLRDEHTRSIAPMRPLATEALRLEHRLSDLVNAAYRLTPDETALLWQTAPPRMPISGPGHWCRAILAGRLARYKRWPMEEDEPLSAEMFPLDRKWS